MSLPAPTAVPIEVERLTRSYGKQRGIVDVSFAAREGEIFAFLGPNGAGKTTTIRTLMGLLRPTSGSARMFGIDCWSHSARAKASVGFVPGEMHLYEGLTGRELLDHFARLRGTRDERHRRALLDRLELDASLHIRHMSKGNRQKLGLVQALMHGAPLLILDEPSSGLDPLKQVAFLDLLREERAEGRTVFLSSHAIPEVQRVADRVAIVREGRIVAVEDVAALTAKRGRHAHVTFAAPVDPAQFAGLDAITVLSATEDHRTYELAVPGDLRPLLRRLVELPLEDLAIETDDLETVFLRYYAAERRS